MEKTDIQKEKMTISPNLLRPSAHAILEFPVGDVCDPLYYHASRTV